MKKGTEIKYVGSTWELRGAVGRVIEELWLDAPERERHLVELPGKGHWVVQGKEVKEVQTLFPTSVGKRQPVPESWMALLLYVGWVMWRWSIDRKKKA